MEHVQNSFRNLSHLPPNQFVGPSGLSPWINVSPSGRFQERPLVVVHVSHSGPRGSNHILLLYDYLRGSMALWGWNFGSATQRLAEWDWIPTFSDECWWSSLISHRNILLVCRSPIRIRKIWGWWLLLLYRFPVSPSHVSPHVLFQEPPGCVKKIDVRWQSAGEGHVTQSTTRTFYIGISGGIIPDAMILKNNRIIEW